MLLEMGHPPEKVLFCIDNPLKAIALICWLIVIISRAYEDQLNIRASTMKHCCVICQNHRGLVLGHHHRLKDVHAAPSELMKANLKASESLSVNDKVEDGESPASVCLVPVTSLSSTDAIYSLSPIRTLTRGRAQAPLYGPPQVTQSGGFFYD